MDILVICDDYWHPAPTAQAGLAFLAAEGHALDWLLDAGEWSAEGMAHYPLVIFVKSNNVSATDQRAWMDEPTQRAFQVYVERGGGLLAIHSGTAEYSETPIFRRLLGGVFVKHPPQCAVTVTPLGDGPLTAGVAPFTVQDEHYVIALDDAQAQVFLETRSEHGTQPGGWLRRPGQGRVCVLTPGHNLPVWQHPSFQTLVRNAVRWCRPDLS